MASSPSDVLKTVPVILVDVDGGIYNNSVRKEMFKDLFARVGDKTISSSAASRRWKEYADAAHLDTINTHVVDLLNSMRRSIPNLEIWFMGDRSEAHTLSIVHELKKLGFLSSECKGIITSRTGRFSFWNDFKIKEFYLGKYFLSKGCVPMLALDDRDKTLDMYAYHGVNIFKVYNQRPALTTINYIYAKDEMSSELSEKG